MKLATPNFLLPYSPFKNLQCSTNNLLMVEADTISVALNILVFHGLHPFVF